METKGWWNAAKHAVDDIVVESVCGRAICQHWIEVSCCYEHVVTDPCDVPRRGGGRRDADVWAFFKRQNTRTTVFGGRMKKSVHLGGT